MAELSFLRFWVVIWLKNITNIEKREPPKLVSGVKLTFYLIERELLPNFVFTILGSNLTKKYHQYRKKWTFKTGVKSTFYLIERELWPNFLRFSLVIWLKNITYISKKVNLQNWCQIDFLPNRTRVMAEFRF